MSSRLVRPARVSAVAAVAVATFSAVSSSPELASVPVAGTSRQLIDHPRPQARFANVQPQAVEPVTTVVSRKDRDKSVRFDGPRGRRVWSASQLASHDVPQAAVHAYRDAAATLARTDPSCRLPWTLLAAIGRVESDHGRYGGAVLSTDGVTRPQIIGVPLNGKGPVAAIHDTDRGRLDGDKTWDRAVGPMQFIPSTWAGAGRDGDGDGDANPHDLDDAALAAGDYLCAGSSLADDAGMDAAIFRYNPSDYYVRLVRAFEEGYRTGVFVIPSPEAPAPEDRKDAKDAKDAKDKASKNSRNDGDDARDGRKDDRDGADRPGAKGSKPGPKDDPEPKPKPQPSPKPSPKPSPSPTPGNPPTPSQPAPQPGTPGPSPTSPAIEIVTGTLAACGVGWCLDGISLDLGPASVLSQTAAADYDGRDGVESLSDELATLAGSGPVTIEAGRVAGVLIVQRLAGLAFPR